MTVAADEHASPASLAGRVHCGIFDQPDLVAKKPDFSAFVSRTLRFDRTGGEQRAAFGLHRDTATLRTVRGRDAARFKRDILGRLEDDLAGRTDRRGIGADDAVMGDQPGVDADAPAVGDDAAEVYRLVVRRIDDHAHVGRAGIDQFDAVAGGEYHIALRAGDHAAVVDVRRDQVKLPAGQGGEAALILDASGIRVGGEVIAAVQEIGIGKIERGDHQPGHIHLRARAEQHAVGVDQEHAAVGLQRAENAGGILTDHAVEHAGRCRLLDEARRFIRADGKALPVDDRAWAVGDVERIALLRHADHAAGHARADRVGIHRTGDDETGCHRDGGNLALPGFTMVGIFHFDPLHFFD